MHKLANETGIAAYKLAYKSNRNYRLFEPRDETGIAASLLCEKLILFDRILLDHRSIRE